MKLIIKILKKICSKFNLKFQYLTLKNYEKALSSKYSLDFNDGTIFEWINFKMLMPDDFFN